MGVRPGMYVAVAPDSNIPIHGSLHVLVDPMTRPMVKNSQKEGKITWMEPRATATSGVFPSMIVLTHKNFE